MSGQKTVQFVSAFGGVVRLLQVPYLVKDIPGQIRRRRNKGTEVCPCTESSRHQSLRMAKTASTNRSQGKSGRKIKIVKGHEYCTKKFRLLRQWKSQKVVKEVE